LSIGEGGEKSESGGLTEYGDVGREGMERNWKGGGKRGGANTQVGRQSREVGEGCVTAKYEGWRGEGRVVMRGGGERRGGGGGKWTE